MVYINSLKIQKNRKKRSLSRNTSYLAKLTKLSGSLFVCLLLSLSFSCKKSPKPLSRPPQPSSFVWGENVQKSAAKLQDSGWALKSQNKQEVILSVPVDLIKEEKDLAILKDLAQREAPDLAQISLYPEKGKLILARLSRIDTKARISEYQEKLLSAYGLKKALWSAQGKTTKDKIGNTYKSQAALYEQKELFVLIRHSSMEAVETRLAKGRNHNIEVLFYNKKNPGLTSENLIKQLEKEGNTKVK